MSVLQGLIEPKQQIPEEKNSHRFGRIGRGRPVYRSLATSAFERKDSMAGTKLNFASD